MNNLFYILVSCLLLSSQAFAGRVLFLKKEANSTKYLSTPINSIVYASWRQTMKPKADSPSSKHVKSNKPQEKATYEKSVSGIIIGSNIRRCRIITTPEEAKFIYHQVQENNSTIVCFIGSLNKKLQPNAIENPYHHEYLDKEDIDLEVKQTITTSTYFVLPSDTIRTEKNIIKLVEQFTKD